MPETPQNAPQIPDPDLAPDSGLYPAQFHRESAPLWLCALAASRGAAPPEVKGARWCEIGCGQGFDAVLLAAANPETSFLGIDPHPPHVAAARALAEAAGVENVAFLEADIRDWEAHEALRQPFDFIVSHGVYSWVSPEVRAALRRFLGERLAPGGIALTQYMAWPGGALHLAIGRLLAGLGRAQDVKARVGILLEMAEAGAGFFAAWPQAAEILRRMAKQSAAFVAHEYEADYAQAGAEAETSSILLAQMRAEGLSWIGSAQPFDNYDDVSLPAKSAARIAAEPDPLRRELLRDLARNQHKRLDLHMRAPRMMTPVERAALARRRRFLLAAGAPPPRASGAASLDPSRSPKRSLDRSPEPR